MRLSDIEQQMYTFASLFQLLTVDFLHSSIEHYAYWLNHSNERLFHPKKKTAVFVPGFIQSWKQHFDTIFLI